MNPANGNGQVQVSAQDAARAALTFMTRIRMADVPPHERGMFDVAEQFLKGLADGSIMVAQLPAASPPALTPAPPLDA